MNRRGFLTRVGAVLGAGVAARHLAGQPPAPAPVQVTSEWLYDIQTDSYWNPASRAWESEELRQRSIDNRRLLATRR